VTPPTTEKEATMSEISLHSDVMKALADDPIVHADEVAVEVRDGVAILHGTVGTPVQRAEAVRIARGVPGVLRVDDQLRVHEMSVIGQADADTQSAVMDALLVDDEVNAGGVEVEVQGGTVTLRGRVALASQRDRAQRIALRVPGVRHVRNELEAWSESGDRTAS
jgi:osmotically-inducible protein OsmY